MPPVERGRSRARRSRPGRCTRARDRPRRPDRPRSRAGPVGAGRVASSSFAGDAVDRGDRLSALGDRPDDRAQAHSTRTDHDDRLPRLHVRGVPDRADPGRHRAADQGSDLRRRPRVDPDRCRGRHDLPLAERADPAVGADRVAVGRCSLTSSGASRWPLPSGREHSHGSLRRQLSQEPHGAVQARTTRSPTSRSLTPSPISSTHAAPSWPITTSVGRSHSPSTTWRSE